MKLYHLFWDSFNWELYKRIIEAKNNAVSCPLDKAAD